MIKKLKGKSNEIDTTKEFSFEEEIDEVEEFEENIESVDFVDEIEDEEDIDDVGDEVDYSDDDESEEEIEEEPIDDDNSFDVLEDEDNEEDAEPDDEDDLFTVKKKKRKPKLGEGDLTGLITEVLAERKLSGKFGKPWINIGLKFKAKNLDTGEYGEVTFNANKSLDPKSRLYPVVKGILGREPGDNFNLKELKGKKAIISIEHRTDSEGNVWENIVAVRKYIPKKK